MRQGSPCTLSPSLRVLPCGLEVLVIVGGQLHVRRVASYEKSQSQKHASKWQRLSRVAKITVSHTPRSYLTQHLYTMSGEDDDLKLQRASSALLTDLEKLLPRLVRGRQHGSATSPVRQYVREVDMYRACALVCPTLAFPRAMTDFLYRSSPSRKIHSFLIRI